MGRLVDYGLIYRLEDERQREQRDYVCPVIDVLREVATAWDGEGNWYRLPADDGHNGQVTTSGLLPFHCDECHGEFELCTECGHPQRYHGDGFDGGCAAGEYINDEGRVCNPCNCGNNWGR